MYIGMGFDDWILRVRRKILQGLRPFKESLAFYLNLSRKILAMLL